MNALKMENGYDNLKIYIVVTFYPLYGQGKPRFKGFSYRNTGDIKGHTLFAYTLEYATLEMVVRFLGCGPPTGDAIMYIHSREVVQWLTGKCIPSDPYLQRLLKQASEFAREHPGICFEYMDKSEMSSYTSEIELLKPVAPDRKRKDEPESGDDTDDDFASSGAQEDEQPRWSFNNDERISSLSKQREIMSTEQFQVVTEKWTGLFFNQEDSKRSKKGIFFKTSLYIDTGVFKQHLIFVQKGWDIALLKGLVRFWEYLPQSSEGTLLLDMERPIEWLTGKLEPTDQTAKRLLKRIQKLLGNHPGIHFDYINRSQVSLQIREITKGWPVCHDDDEDKDDDQES